MRPFEELDGNPIWEEYQRQAENHPDQINLTDLWRIAGRKRGVSPRQWARDSRRKYKIQFEGRSADAPALTDEATAMTYVQDLDPNIRIAVGTAFFRAIRTDPAGWLLNAANHSESAASIAGMFISAANAISGNRIEGDARIMGEVVQRTQGLGTYAQETQVAKAQRALAGARAITTGRLINGEFIEDL